MLDDHDEEAEGRKYPFDGQAQPSVGEENNVDRGEESGVENVA